MSSVFYLNKMRNESVMHNPYYEFFRDSLGKGNNLYVTGTGDIYRNLPDFQRGYGVVRKDTLFPGRVQLGTGLWSTIFNFAKPLLRKALPYVAKGMKEVAKLSSSDLVRRGINEAVDMSSNIAQDVLSGANIKDAVKQNIKTTLKSKLPDQFSGLIDKTIGTGRRRKKYRNKKVALSRKKTKRKNIYPGLNLIP